jgi:replicative DNA helicase
MVLLSQFNRETSRNRAERPTAQGLMGGSALENDSHQVLLFDHSRFTRTANLADTWLIVDKNRHGATTDLPVQWDYRTLRLSSRVPSITETEEKHGRIMPKWKERG